MSSPIKLGRGHYVRSSETLAKMSAAMKGRKKSEEHKAKLRKPKSEVTKAKLKISLSSSSSQERRKNTVRERYGVEYTSQIKGNNPMSVEFWIRRGHSKEAATLRLTEFQRLNASKKKIHTSYWRPDHWIRLGFSPEEAVVKVSQAQVRNAQKARVRISKCSTAFLNLVEVECGVRIEREVELHDRFLVDGFIPEINLVIEFYGTFWHMHPDVFGPDDINRVTKWKASSKWAEDAGRVKYLEAAGRTVIVVWENNAGPEVVLKVADFIVSQRLKQAA